GSDSPLLLSAVAGAPARIISYGLSARADVRPDEVEDRGPEGSRFRVEGFPPVRLRLIGMHQVANALAALAVARHLRIDPAAVVAALREELGPGTVVLLKASRGAALEDVLAGLPVELEEA